MHADYCDVHNHLLPAVDDGSESLGETLEYLARFREAGVAILVFTPHLLAAELDGPGIDSALRRHRRAFRTVEAATLGNPRFPRLHLGQEVLARHPGDLDGVVARQDVGLGGSDALLVEFGFAPPFDPEGVIQRVVAEGRTPVVAHPERYRLPGGDPVGTMERWRHLGARLQVNGGSIRGEYTPAARRTARELLQWGLVDLIASDHHGHFRPHDPGPTASAVVEEVGEGAATRLMGTAPRDLLALETAGSAPTP